MTTIFRKSIAAAVLVFAVTACSGGGTSSPAPTGPNGPLPELGEGLTPQTTSYISEKYGHMPELLEAAQGWAEAKEGQLLEESRTGVFNEASALKTAHSQLCLYFKGSRLGSPLSEDDVTKFVATFAVTPARLRAVVRSNQLASGTPLELQMTESKACRDAKGQ